MKAIVIGGTGATGRELVKQLLDDARIDKIVALVRRPYFAQHPKLTEVVVDFEKLGDHTALIRGDVAFSCLGTTLKDAGSKAAQWRVDHDFQLEFASLAKANGMESFVLLSAVGANPKSAFFYNKMKGTLEENIRKLNFKQFITLHPGGIERPGTARKGEKMMISTIKTLNSIGIMRGYAPVATDRLAKAMIASFFAFKTGDKSVTLSEIKKLGELP